MSAVDTAARRAMRLGGRVGRRGLLELAHAIEERHQGAPRRPLREVDRAVVEALDRGDAAAVPLDRLALPSTPALEAAGRRLLDALAAAPAPAGPPLPRIWTATTVAEVRAWGTEPALLAIAEHHIGSPVVFQGAHARIEPAHAQQVTSDLWHRDVEDRRMLKAFVFLDEVTADHGPFEHVCDADVPPGVRRRVRRAIASSGRMGLTDDEMAALVPRDRWQRAVVPARTVVFADPTGSFHHGSRRTRPRAALFFVWTSATPLRPADCLQYWDGRYPFAPLG